MLVEPAVPWTQARVARESWSNPLALRAGPEWPRRSGGPAGPRARPRVAFGTWSTPPSLRTGPESPKTSGRTRGPWNPSASHPGLLFDPSGTRTEARVARESWSSPGALGPRASSLGQLFDTAAPSKVQSLPGCLLKPWALGHGPDSPERQVNPADPPTRSQVSLEVGRHRRHSDPGPILLGLLVKSAGTWTQDRVARDSWSTTRALGPKDESPGTSGRPCLP